MEVVTRVITQQETESIWKVAILGQYAHVSLPYTVLMQGTYHASYCLQCIKAGRFYILSSKLNCHKTNACNGKISI